MEVISPLRSEIIPKDLPTSGLMQPVKSIYTLCFLDSHGSPTQFIVLGGISPHMTDDEIKLQIFSDDQERLALTLIQPSPTFRQSSQQIHLDDSIRTIKKKIIHELGANNICYEEIYLFSNHNEKVPLLPAYQQITKRQGESKLGKGATRLERQLQELENISTDLDKRTLGQFLLNMKVDNTSDILQKTVLDRDTFVYEDLLPIMPKESTYVISKPLGQRFAKGHQWLFPGNPFDILTGDGEPIFKKTKQNDLYVFENHLLMNYGNIEKKIIYVCLAKNVLDYAVENSIDPTYIVDLYYPLLHKKGINNSDTFEENHQSLISQNKDLINDTTFRLFDTVDSFYNIYYSRTTDLPYLDRGIESFDIVIHPDFDVPLPLDIIFKQIHASTTIPFIKYNPGLRRENMFRLYSEEIAKNGKRIPHLKKSQIYAISKTTGKLRQISLFIQHETKRQVVDIFVDFEYNGNIRIRGNMIKPISVNDLETIIYNAVNPVITEINGFLERSGYTLTLFETFPDRNVEILQMEYVCKINLKRSMKLKNYMGCLTSLFDIANMEMDITKMINMQFVRVDNYTKMNAIAVIITEVFRRTNNQEEIISALVTNFSMDRDAALKEMVKYFNDHTRIQGQYVNKTVDIADNPGFPVTMTKSPFDDKFTIKVSNITSVDFVDVMHIYFDTILRISQFSETANPDLLNKMSTFCSSKPAIISEVGVDNVLAAAPLLVAPLVFEEVEEEEEDEGEGEDEEEDEEEGDEFNEDHIMSKDKIVVNKNASGSEPNKINSNIVGGDSDDDEGSVDDDENYLQKFDESLKQNIISEWHHEDQVHNDEEVETMCTVVRDANGFIIDPLHKTLPFVTKYEKARILGERAKQLDAGAKPFVTLKDNIIDSYLIALKEFEAKKIPFVVRRPLPNGACEYWRLRDLEYLE